MAEGRAPGGRPRRGPADLIGEIRQLIGAGHDNAHALMDRFEVSRTTIHRVLQQLEREGQVHKIGRGHSTRWKPGKKPAHALEPEPVRYRRPAMRQREPDPNRRVDPPWFAPRDGFTSAMQQRQEKLQQSSTSAEYSPDHIKVHR